jgi:hypothetical protein
MKYISHQYNKKIALHWQVLNMPHLPQKKKRKKKGSAKHSLSLSPLSVIPSLSILIAFLFKTQVHRPLQWVCRLHRHVNCLAQGFYYNGFGQWTGLF